VHEKSSAQHKFSQRATVKKCNMNNEKLGKWPPPPTRGSTRVLVGGDQNSTDWLFARLKRHSFILFVASPHTRACTNLLRQCPSDQHWSNRREHCDNGCQAQHSRHCNDLNTTPNSC